METIQNSNEYKSSPIFGVIEYMASKPELHEVELRTWATVFIRIYSAGRPQDPAKLFREAISTGNEQIDIKDCKQLYFNLWDTKCIKNSAFNKQVERPSTNKQIAKFDTLETIINPRTDDTIPDYFKILHFYLLITKSRKVTKKEIKIDGQLKQFSPTFIYA